MSRLSKSILKKIRKEYKKNGSIRETARKLGISRNAVKRELRSTDGANGANKDSVNARKTTPQKSKLDPHKAKISFLVENKKLSGVRILEEIQQLGYQGGSTILNEYIRTIKPRRGRGLTTVIDHQPGHEGQMDWSPHRVIVGGREQVVQTGSIILCYSRWLFIHFYTDQTIDSVIDLHKKAFMELGAVPEVITYDNMTTVGFHRGPGEVWLNPQFKGFADEYGFEVIILVPGAKDRHGMVERPFHYIENNFLAGREFEDLEDLNRRGERWREEKANARIHGTLRERPLDRLKRERPFLKPLPHTLTRIHYKEVTRLVHRDFCIAINTNRYSVNPQLLGQYVQVRLYRDHLEIWTDGRNDCQHTYYQGHHHRQVLPEHEKLYRRMTNQKALLENAFLKIGEIARSYYEGLKKEKGAAAGFHLQRILKMVERYGKDVVSGAISYAQRYGAYNSDSVLRVIHGKRVKGKAKHLAGDVNIPENIRQWLKACAVENVENDDLDSFDVFLNDKETETIEKRQKMKKNPKSGNQESEEEERGDKEE